MIDYFVFIPRVKCEVKACYLSARMCWNPELSLTGWVLPVGWVSKDGKASTMRIVGS